MGAGEVILNGVIRLERLLQRQSDTEVPRQQQYTWVNALWRIRQQREREEVALFFLLFHNGLKKKKDWTKRDKLSALDAMEESNANKVSGYILLLTFWGCACGWATQLHHHRPNQVTLLSRLRSGEDPSISLGSDRKYNIITESDTVIACLTFGIVTDAHG